MVVFSRGKIQRGRESLLYVDCGLGAKTTDPFELAHLKGKSLGTGFSRIKNA